MLNRRDFLKSSTILAALALKPGSMPGESKPQKANTIGRLVLPMNRNWRFSPQHIADATARDFDDSGFAGINVLSNQTAVAEITATTKSRGRKASKLG